MKTVDIKSLSFRYKPGLPPVLRGVDLALEQGTRTVLIGANGAGKTTLLRVAAGKHLIARDAVTILGRPAFHDTSLAADVALLSGIFPFYVDVSVSEILEGQVCDDMRRKQLVDLLAVDLNWRMHAVSDGQRRRVQLLVGLLHPYKVLLLDEITTDLDLVARMDLLRFLREETEDRNVTVLYATHILDRLEDWATHLAFIDKGTLLRFQPIGEIEELGGLREKGVGSPLTSLAESWLRQPPSKIVPT